jgi:hypothetical protein
VEELKLGPGRPLKRGPGRPNSETFLKYLENKKAKVKKFESIYLHPFSLIINFQTIII